MQDARRKVGQTPSNVAEMRDAIRRKIGAAYASGDLATLQTLQNLANAGSYYQPQSGRVLDTYVPDQPSGRVLDTYVPDPSGRVLDTVLPTRTSAPLPSPLLMPPSDPTLDLYPPTPYYPNPCNPGGVGADGSAAGFLPGGSNAPRPWVDPCGAAWNETNKYCRATFKSDAGWYGGYTYGMTILSGPGRLISLQAVCNPLWALATPLYLLLFDVADPSQIGSGVYPADKVLGPFNVGSIGLYEPYGEDFFEFIAPDGTVRRQAGGWPVDNGLYVIVSTDPTFWVSVGGAGAPSNTGVITGFAVPPPFRLTGRVQTPIA